METVLLYQIKGTKTAVLLKPVLLKLGIRVRIVEPDSISSRSDFLPEIKHLQNPPKPMTAPDLMNQ